MFIDEDAPSTMRFRFMHQQNDIETQLGSSTETCVVFKDDEQWTEVLRKFLDFLGSVYGYDIRKQVDYPNK